MNVLPLIVRQTLRLMRFDVVVGWLPILEVPNGVVPKDISVRGYYHDLNKDEPKNKPSLYGQDNCKAEAIEGNFDSKIWKHFCSTRPKASGSPLIGTYDGKRGVFAIVVAERKAQNKIFKTYDSEFSNRAVDMTRVMSEISVVIENSILLYEQQTAERARSTKLHEI